MWIDIQGVPVPDQCGAIYREYQYQINVQRNEVFDVDTVHSETIQTPCLFHILLRYNLILKLIKLSTPPNTHTYIHTTPHNDQAKDCCTFRKKQLKHDVYIMYFVEAPFFHLYLTR
jgi:hypothetical protein